MRTLYHVTPTTNAKLILAFGVLPSLSEGKRPWSYWVNEEQIYWAISHVCNKRRLFPNDLSLCVATHSEFDLIRTCFRGVFARDVVVEVTDVIAVKLRHLADPDDL